MQCIKNAYTEAGSLTVNYIFINNELYIHYNMYRIITLVKSPMYNKCISILKLTNLYSKTNETLLTNKKNTDMLFCLNQTKKTKIYNKFKLKVHYFA